MRGRVATRDAELALRVCHGVVARFGSNLIQLDVSHQGLEVHGEYERDLRAATANVVAAAYILQFLRK